MEVLEIFEQSLIFTLAIAIPSTVIICIFKFSPPTLGDLGGRKSQSMTTQSIVTVILNLLRLH
jgi:hypothetical protein